MQRYLKINIPPTERRKADGIVGMVWLKKEKMFRFPIRSLPDMVSVFPHLIKSEKIQNILSAIEQHQARMDLIEAGSVSSRCPEWLWQHQKKAVTYGLCNKRFAFFLDMGTGKTLVMLTLITLLRLKCIIVAPLALLEGAWGEDIQKFFPNLKYLIYQGTNRRKAYHKWTAGKHDLLITNFDTYRRDFKDLSSLKYDCMIVDESSKIKNPGSKTTKMIKIHAEQIERVYLLSGTPAPNTPLEYFPQISTLDTGILGDNYYKFRQIWGQNISKKTQKWNTFVFRKELIDELTKRLSKICYVVKKDECLDLPVVTHTPWKVDMEKEQAAIYRKMFLDCVTEIEGTEIMAQQAITKVMKLREITSGFCYDEDKNVKTVPTNKDKEIVSILELIGNEQVIIWINFRVEAKKMLLLFKDKTIVEAHGGIPHEKQLENIDRFKKGDAQILVGHPASIGHGLTLVNCRYAIYYSMSHSYEQYAQSRDRIHRGGQTKKCQYFYLLCRGTIDTQIYNAVINKQRVADSVLKEISGG